jgi:23S rRNA (cytidine1920-2'-O)/16S rRNA (cytidine1409-2'-O)-methyltransferase
MNPKGLVWLDAGASTGGFTDCLLSRGALAVHAVDVGYNQLAWKLRSDKRVIVHEKTNIMEVEKKSLVPSPSFAVADLSFRSLRGAASKILSLLKPASDAGLIALVKPQFENPDEENFNGVVKSQTVIKNVLELLAADLEHEGVYIENAALSAIAGRKGNSEIFLLLSADPERKPPDISEKFNSVMEEIRKRQESAKLSLPSGLPTGKPSPPR